MNQPLESSALCFAVREADGCRQAEWGVGDCGGLNFVPGATKNGKQKSPEWLNGVMGVKEEAGIDMEKLLGPRPKNLQ
jgi:hypothetical protein